MSKNEFPDKLPLAHLLELRKYFNFGMDKVAEGVTLYEILHGEIVLDEYDEDENDEIPTQKFEDLDHEYAAAVLLGVATKYEDIIREIPKRQLKKLKQAVFHTKKLPEEDDF